MRSLSILFAVILVSCSLSAQSWTRVDERSIPQLGKRAINPERYIIASVNDTEIRNILWSAPDELTFDPGKDTHTLLNVMMPDESVEEFSIVRYQMMEPGLAKRYDHIRTFHGLSTSDASKRIRINYTVHGLRATITDQTGQVYIDHFQRNDKTHKIIYKRNNLAAHDDWSCGFMPEKLRQKKNNSSGFRSGDCDFRSYRFSMTTTGEYSNYHDAFSEADSSLVMSAVVTTMDRVNEVFEQDITVRFILIDNVDDIFYYDPATDPFSGSSAGSMITQNQTNTDAVIGSANYDIGHIVSTGGSGLASLGVICANGAKARGVTGISIPEGDPFDIDYVSHEIGHQLGANHTQNNSCNRNSSTAMEPGSASTIMGYAGICSPNVQSNSDAYFHAISIQEMNNEITSNSCHTLISLNNGQPDANPLVDKIIPRSTPFVLDVVASDPDDDVLTYNWEQMDNEVGQTMPPASTNTLGPMFRSKFATTDSKRYFPNLETLTSNGTDTWEVLPSVGRTMDFRVTVRDNTFLPGCTDEEDISLAVASNAGPFLVTSHNTATTWLETESVTISWDVANTNASPVNCGEVDILLSYDGGFTYPVVLASEATNNGSAIVTVPMDTTNNARIMVKCSNNVFFDINDTDIVIEPGIPSFMMDVTPTSGSACDDESISFNLNTTSTLGFSDPITLSVSDLPPGATANITTNPIDPDDSTLITLDNLDGNSGVYQVKITGTAGSIIKETTYELTVINDAALPTLSSPANGSSGALKEPTLIWDSYPGATSYEYEVSTSPNGGNVVNSGSTIDETVTITPELEISTTYYWRVRSNTDCGMSPWSEDWTFETSACFEIGSSDVPKLISSSGTPTITSTLNFVDKGIITDLNVVNLEGTHTYISDLNFTLIAPDNTSNAFWSDPCNWQNNFDINFDDEAANNNYPCPPTDGLVYLPDSPLDVFNSVQLQGEWTLSVFDDLNFDGGSLNSWGLEVCLDQYCDLTVDKSVFDNTNGTLQSAIECAVDGDTIFLQNVIANSTIDAGENSIFINHDIVIIADSGDNIKVKSNGESPTFIISAGKTVSLIGFDIENTVSTDGVLENMGSLTLENVDIITSPGQSSIINDNTGSVLIKGNCNVLEN